MNTQRVNRLLFLLSLALLITALPIGAVHGEVLQVVIDDYPPFSYQENGEIKGLSTEVLKAALEVAGLTANITQYPFVRAYKMSQEEPNVFEYCVARTPEREPLFQWVGIVAMADHGLLALKDRDIQITKLEDLKAYTIGTVVEDVVDQYLRARVDQLGLRLDRVASYELNMKKLLGERFDLYAGNVIAGKYLAEKAGKGADAVKPVYTFEELTVPYYLVTGLKTSPELVKKLQDAFATIHQNGTFQKIVDGYFQKK